MKKLKIVDQTNWEYWKFVTKDKFDNWIAYIIKEWLTKPAIPSSAKYNQKILLLNGSQLKKI